ncbi:MAG: diacylglycerol/lipid kinase family protein [Bacteroidia bacterium]
MKTKLLFIVNPIAGKGKKNNVLTLIDKIIDKKNYEYEIKIWEKWDDVGVIVENGIKQGINIFAAVGGDGTVNEVSKKLIGTDKKLAIIPSGSGNGIARHLKIPINTKKALKLINQGNTNLHDTGLINSKPFIMCAGVGFDAHVAYLFSKENKRGLKTYIKIIAHEFSIYKPLKYELKIDGKKIEKKAFLISIANCSQFGNNAWIAPQAKSNDGILNITLIKPFLPFYAPSLVRRLFLKTIHKSKFVETFKGKEIEIKHKNTIAQYDGEAFEAGKNIQIKIVPNSLYIITP